MLRALRQFVQRLHKRKKKPERLQITDHGLALFENDREIYRFCWAEVSKIETYKRDQFSVDMICLDFTVDAAQTVYMTNDEMDGFSELSSRLVQYFPSIAPDWWSDVAFPAFAAKHKVLYERRSA